MLELINIFSFKGLKFSGEKFLSGQKIIISRGTKPKPQSDS